MRTALSLQLGWFNSSTGDMFAWQAARSGDGVFRPLRPHGSAIAVPPPLVTRGGGVFEAGL